ncbi:MAG TPA: radical SAM protein [Actinobacteria bacterium]|nr:radical SAM protein [Actinomycetota bacterium]
MEGIIGTTYRCNAKCYMCGTWKFPTKPTEEIRPELLKKLPRMTFTNITGGEPFLRNDIQEIVEIVRPKTKRIVISTNGFFTNRIIEFAKDNRDVGFRISLEGLPRTNDQLRGIKNGFDKSLRTLLELKSLGLKDIGFGITISDTNAKDLLELFRLANSMSLEFATAVTHNSYYFHKFDNQIVDKAMVAGELNKLIWEFLKSKRPKDWFRAYFNYGLINYIYGGKRLLPCEVGADVFYLDPFGKIRPCNGMDEIMGDLETHDFGDIWQSAEAQAARNKVAACAKNCWMIGSASPAMKKAFAKPAKWIIQNKFLPGKRDQFVLDFADKHLREELIP